MSVFADQVRAFKRDLLLRTLVETGGVRVDAALRLGIRPSHLWRMLHDLDVKAGRPPGTGTCTACGEKRHNRRTCPNRPPAQTNGARVRDPGRRLYAVVPTTRATVARPRRRRQARKEATR